MNPFKDFVGTLVIKAEPSSEPPSQAWIDGCKALDEYGKKMMPILLENDIKARRAAKDIIFYDT